MDDELVKDYLENISDSIEIIEERFKEIKSVDDFVNRPYGITLLDSISMRLQVIGESVININKNDKNYLYNYGEIV
ncbi:MAG: hypothetical protein EHM58_01165 [Ignavibacteriae bacterium]|nr:MAG: hypothetical protein EHM58_01165 [Ignavibacteriota bacterium]